MKLPKLRAFVEYLLDNLFDIITIIMAGYLVARGQLRPFTNEDIPELATWILAVLGLIAVSGLWDRNRRMDRIEKLSEESRNLTVRYLGGKIHADDFFQAEHEIPNSVLASANNIFFVGVTLSGTATEYASILRQRLVSGAKIRIVIVEPTDAVLEDLKLRSWAKVEPTYYPDRLRSVESQFEYIVQESTGKGKLELGHLPFHPSFGLVMVDPDQPHGVCYVTIYPHKLTGPRPSFEVRASDDPMWYNFFRKQFDILWSSCRVETLPKETQPNEQKE
jgi:hypothetical protein